MGPAAYLDALIIDAIDRGLVVVDPSGQILRANRRSKTILAGNPDTLPIDFPDARLLRRVRTVMSSGEPVTELAFRLERDGEEDLTLRLDLTEIAQPAQGACVLITFSDDAERLGRDRRIMETARLASLGDMVAGIAHEINNPMAAVMGLSQLLLRRELDPAVRWDIERIASEAERAAKVVAGLRSFAGRDRSARSTVDVREVVNRVLGLKSYQLRLDKVSATTRFEPDAAPVSADPGRLEQAFLNIVTNAQQSLAASDGSLLTVTVGRPGGVVRVTFTDDGTGIAEDDIGRVFDPFFTTREVGMGAGLGLSVCYGIVHEHGGAISVESSPGEGATFTVDLPVAAGSDNTAAGGAAIDVRRPGSSLHILVADDEPLVAELMSRILSEWGHSVRVARSGEEVEQDSPLDRYELILLDVVMPGIGGTDLYEKIKDMSPPAAERVVFVTGDTVNGRTMDLISRTGRPLLTKPFALNELRRIVDRYASSADRHTGA